MGDLNEKEASGVTKIVSKDEDYAVEVNSLGEMSVSVQNQPTITVGNSSLNTNATITNSSISVTSDKLGKTSYSSADVEAMSSLSLRDMISYYQDGVLSKIYNESYDSNSGLPAVSYHNFPEQEGGTKCLKRVRTFESTSPYQMKSEDFLISDWTTAIESAINPPLVLTAGTITHPANNASEGTTVCSFTFSGGHSSSSAYTFSSNSNLYYLKADSGTAAQTITATSGQTVSLCTSSNFADYSSTGYTHTTTVTLSDSIGLSSSTSVDVVTTQGGATAYSNTKCFNNSGAGNADYFTISNLISGSNQVLGKEHDWTISFWYKGTDSNGPIFGGSNDHSSFHCLIYSLAGHDNLMLQYNQGSVSYTGTDIHDGNWKHVCITFKAAPSGTNWYWLRDDSSGQSGIAVYINNTRATSITQTAGSSNLSAELFSGSDFRFFSRGTWSDSAQGDYDEIAIFDSCKSDSEVANIYSSGTPDDLSSDTSCKVYLRADGMSTANITNGMTITNSSTASDASNYVTTATTDNAGDLEVKDLTSSESIYVSGSSFSNTKHFTKGGTTSDYFTTTNLTASGSNQVLQNTKAWTISWWYKTDTIDTGAFWGHTNSWQNMHCGIMASNRLLVQGPGGEGGYAYYNFIPSTDTWYHIVVTNKPVDSDGDAWYFDRDDSAGQKGIKVYVNGSAVAQHIAGQSDGAAETGHQWDTGSDFRLFDRGSWNDLHGDYDEISVHTETKSSAQVTAMYNSGTPTDLSTDSTAVVWLRADSMTTAGIANNATITNSVGGSSASTYVTTCTTSSTGNISVSGLASSESIYVSGSSFSNTKYIKALNYSSNTASYTQYLQTNQHPWGSGNMSATTAWSVSFWMKWEGSTTETNDDGNGYIVNTLNNEDATKAGFIFYISSAGDLWWLFANQSGSSLSGAKYNNTRDTLTDGNWHHVALTHKAGSSHAFSISSSSSFHKLWVDGVFQTPSTAKSSSTQDYSSNNPVTFGNHPYAGRQNALRSADVSIDEITFWDVDLADDISGSSSATITAMYNSGTAVDESSRSGLLEYYRADTAGDSVTGSGYIKCAKHPSSGDHKLIPYYYDASDTRQQGWTYTSDGNGIKDY